MIFASNLAAKTSISTTDILFLSVIQFGKLRNNHNILTQKRNYENTMYMHFFLNSIPSIKSNVNSYELASLEAIRSGSTLFFILIMNPIV